MKDLLSYDPETGEFRWIVAPGRRVKAGDIAGCIDTQGYRTFCVRGKQYRSGRLAWFFMTGEWPPHEIDHINRNRSDDKWCNLRLATRAENNRNRAKPKPFCWGPEANLRNYLKRYGSHEDCA